MTGIIPIIAGILILYLVVTGNVDCYIAAFRACRQQQNGGNSSAVKAGEAPTMPIKPKTPSVILDSILRP
jgi:hypothetical protein